MRKESFLVRTRQAWKPYFGIVVIPGLALAGMVALLEDSFGLPDEVSGFLVMVASLTIVGSFAWVIRSVRCPTCGTRLLLKAMREQTLADWWDWLDSVLLCPVCGSSGDA